MCVRAIFDVNVLRWRKPNVSEAIQRISTWLGRLVCIIFAGYLIWASIPYLKDNYALITSNYVETEGYIVDNYRRYKSLNDNIVINGMEIKFLLGEKVENNTKYRVKYLPNTSTGIYLKDLTN